MADTSASPNNRAIVYRGKPIRERSIPSVSKAQNAAMQSAAEGNSTLGIPKAVGQEFTADQKPGSVKNLPARAHKIAKMRKRGVISDKQSKGLSDKYGSRDEPQIDASSR